MAADTFTLYEYQADDGQVIQSRSIKRKFLGMVKINDVPYFEVERVEDGSTHTIALGIIQSIGTIRILKIDTVSHHI